MLTKQDFIQVNNTIQDYSIYIKEVMLLKRYLKHKLIEIALEEEFKLEFDLIKSYDKNELMFYNKEKDLEIKIEIKKRQEEVFI